MKALPLFLACAVLSSASGLRAVESAPGSPPTPLRTPAELQQLVAPIALYPDPLVALILPAATRPTEIVLALRFLDRGGNAELAGRESWSDAVRALTRYREVLEYLDRNLEWTRQLGEAFLDQPEEVMAAVQAVRARARANGHLSDTREQVVYVEDDFIRIVPASPTIIYVPRYNPTILYVSSAPSTSFWLSFGVGYGVGSWLNYDCDWRYRSVRVLDRPPTWYRSPDWRPPVHRSYFPGPRWAPPPHEHDRDRDGEQRRRDFERRRGTEVDQSRRDPRLDDRRTHDANRPRRHEPSPVPPLSAPTLVSTAPDGPTAASVAATGPSGPTAPTLVSGTDSPPVAPRVNRDDRDGRRDTPRYNRPEREASPDSAPVNRRGNRPETTPAGVRNPRPDTTPPAPRAPRSEAPTARPPRHDPPPARADAPTPRYEPPRPMAPPPPPAPMREDRPNRDGERHPTPDEREPR